MKNNLIIILFFVLHNISFAQDGTLDSSFDDDGILRMDFNNFSDAIQAIIVQPDGKIITAGYASDSTAQDFCTIRFNPDGSLDTGFGIGGIVITKPLNFSQASDLALQSDGKIVVVGNSVLIRYHSDGTLDDTFGDEGIVMASISGYSPNIASVEIQQNGKMLAGGQVFDSPPDGSSFVVLRYNQDGSLDTSFGTGGGSITDVSPGSGLGALEVLRDIKIQQNGKIIAAGVSGPNATLVAYNSDGSLDTDFGLDGIVAQNFSMTGNSVFNGLDIQEDGKIVAAGFSTSGSSDFLVARYNSDGTPDDTFGNMGFVLTPISPQQDGANSILVQPDGKILAGGTARNSIYRFALARYDVNGTPDATFGTNGIVETAIDSSTFSSIESIALQPDGKILAAGFASNSSYDICIARYNSTTFLPIEISTPLQVRLQNQTALLTWRTETETNNAGFEIQRSKDGIQWERIGWQAGQGNTSSSHSYTYIDKNPFSGTSYYRLKQVDISGDFSYSGVVSLRYVRTQVNVYPNPVQDKLHIYTNEQSVGQVLIFNSSGRQFTAQVNNNSIDVSTFPSGIYTIKLTVNSEDFYEKIVVE